MKKKKLSNFLCLSCSSSSSSFRSRFCYSTNSKRSSSFLRLLFATKKNDAGVGESLLGQKSRDNNTTATRLRSKERERYENNFIYFLIGSLFSIETLNNQHFFFPSFFCLLLLGKEKERAPVWRGVGFL